MSSLLEQAVIDAKALKETAMKNAEAAIIDKYSDEVKSTLRQLLEQDEIGNILSDLGTETPSPDAEATMDKEVDQDEIAEGVPDAFTEDSTELGGVNEGDDAQITIDFKELAEALQTLRQEETETEVTEEVETKTVDEEIEIDENSIKDMVAEILSEEDTEDDLYGEGAEDLPDGLLEKIMEKLTVDMGASLSGWAGRSSDDVKHQMELEMAHRRSTEVQEELEALKKAQEELVFENKRLKQRLSNYQQVVDSLKENVQDVNVSNAHLLYTNRTLRNTSLNERQKHKIVEAISKAGSVEEAKTIYETLQSTVTSAPNSKPRTLNEAITRPTSIIRASRKEEPKTDPFSERMRKLAGIN